MDNAFIESFPENPEIKLMTASQAAKVLEVTPKHVYELMKRGEIPMVQFGKVKRIRYADLERFIEKHLEGETS